MTKEAAPRPEPQAQGQSAPQGQPVVHGQAVVHSQAVVQPQEVAAPLTGSAIFLVVTLDPGADSCAAVRDLFSDLAGLLRAVGFRDLDAKLSCVVGIGSEAWDQVAGPVSPTGLHVFR